MSGDNKYAVVFNFYEKIPPPPKFATFVEGWLNMGKFVSKLDHFVSAQLHRNIDPNGKYKYLNFATFNNSNNQVMTDMTEPSPDIILALVENHGPPGLQVTYPGGYNETRTRDETPVAPDVPAKTESCFLVSAFKTTTDLDSVAVEDSVEKLAALDVIAECASSGFEIGDWALYRRFTPKGPFEAFDFVFRCELRGLGTNYDPARALLEKLQAAPTCDGVERSDSAIFVIDKENVTERDAS